MLLKHIKILFLFYLFLPVSGQETGDIYSNMIYDPRIKTVQCYKEGWNLSYPVIDINGDEKLVFQFDLLGDRDETFSYTFVHCDKDWKKSDIFVNDYLEGFNDNPIEEVKASFNTTVNYFHYSISFPNDRVQLRLSGNYVITIFKPEDPENPVIVHRFMIKENRVKTDMTVHRPVLPDDRDKGQQIDFTVDLTGTGTIDPYRNIYCTLLQNGRWDNARTNLKPDIYGGNELKFNSLSDKNVFTGGNEYRDFDIKSIKYIYQNVRRIDFLPPQYHVFLTPSESREFKPYFYWQDFNGKYFIASQEGRDPATDADYVNVYFTLQSGEMAAGGDVYVSGALSNWKFGKENRMLYNSDKRQYECTMLLKQGWYNYEYVFLRDGLSTDVASKYEGSHYETENDYTAIVYYRNPRERYDRILGTGTMNTLNRIAY